MTLLAEVQGVLERTYQSAGINLEDCVIGPSRYYELSRSLKEERELSSRARIFLRQQGDDLAMAIYYSPELLRQLEEEPPQQILSHRNIYAFISFIEEITHGVHIALAFRKGECDLDSEVFYCQLEMQAKIDTYWMLMRFLNLGEPINASDKAWIFQTLFEQESFDYSFRKLRKRYRLANQMARHFVKKVSLLPLSERIKQIREFQTLNFKEQYRYCFS